MRILTAPAESKVILIHKEDAKELAEILDHFGRGVPISEPEIKQQLARYYAEMLRRREC